MKRDEVLKGARWSATVRCPRMGVYSALGAIPSPRSPHVEGMLERGHDLEDVFDRRLRMDYSGSVEREVEIGWGPPDSDWRLHVDFLLADEDRQHLEVKSNVQINDVPGPRMDVDGVVTKSPVLQVVGAATFDPLGGTAAVAVMSPTTYLHREYKIDLTDDLVGAVKHLEDQVVHALTSGELPPRVCTVPSDAVGRFCPYRDTCFADWETVEQVVDDGPVIVLAGQLRQAEEAYKAAKAELDGKGNPDSLKAKRDDLRRQMRDYTKPGLEYVLGGVRVRRTIDKRGRRTFKLTDALATGALLGEEIDGPLSRLGNYVTESDPNERWTVGDPVATDDDDG